jgi:hypothetical protein
VIAISTQSRAAPLRERGDDLYQTPAPATEALLRAERLPRVIWEPAAGRGAIVNVLRAAGHEVVASDLTDHGIPGQHARCDFLMETKAPAGVQAIVTNPPFKLATEFAEHALHLAPQVFMCLRLAFIEGMRRSAIIDGGHLARVHVFRNRVAFHRDGWTGPKHSGAIAFAWFAWDRNHSGPTTLDRIEVRNDPHSSRLRGVFS